MIKAENLDFWIQNHYNVLFVGEHGVGKTSIVKEAFERNNLKWRYYSASTMDPWVDLVGVPKEKRSDDGESYLDLVRPKEFTTDSVEALFFDEFNRSHKKVRNAVMELLQFKSINGKPFSSLKIIWAAINPEDEETYDVERLDPAQEDRFHIHVTVPYKPHKAYFTEKYGEDVSKAALSWWFDLPEEQKKLVSPRRLDYALDVLDKGGDVRYVLPVSTNVSKLITTLEIGPVADKLKKLRKDGDFEAAQTFLSNENNYNAAVKHIVGSPQNLNFFLPCLPNEKLAKLISDEPAVLKSVMNRVGEFENFKQVANDIVGANANKGVAKQIVKFAEKHKIGGIDGTSGHSSLGTKPIYPWHANGSQAIYPDFLTQARQIVNLNGKHYSAHINTQERKKAYGLIHENLPANLSEEQALDTLEVLGLVAARSQKSTLIGLPDFFGACNHCIVALCKATGIKEWKILNKKFNKKIGRLVDKCISDGSLGQRLYKPVTGKVPVWYAVKAGKVIPLMDKTNEQ